MAARKKISDASREINSRLDDARVDEILHVAWQVFSERGFDGATVDEMAKRAKTSKRSFYSRFPTKQALLMAVMSMQVQALKTDLAEFMSPDLSLEEALTSFADRMLTIVLSDQLLATYRVVTLESQRFPELGKMYYENGVAKISRFLAGYLSRLTEQGRLTIPDTEVAAEQFIDSIVGLPRLRAALGISKLGRREKAHRIEIAVSAFLRAYGTQ